MKFTSTSISGAYIVDLDKIEDERGFFARAFCSREFDEESLNNSVAQANLSFSKTKGTIRGLHYQKAPSLETKFVRCINGSIFDVIVDMRPDSPSYLKHAKFELTSANRRALFIPPMVAHGFQTLVENSEVMYLVSEFYSPDCECGLSADDPALAIDWPLPVKVRSDKDANWQLLPKPYKSTNT